eukprot:3065530-Amphidinium_carterae.1
MVSHIWNPFCVFAVHAYLRSVKNSGFGALLTFAVLSSAFYRSNGNRGQVGSAILEIPGRSRQTNRAELFVSAKYRHMVCPYVWGTERQTKKNIWKSLMKLEPLLGRDGSRSFIISELILLCFLDSMSEETSVGGSFNIRDSGAGNGAAAADATANLSVSHKPVILDSAEMFCIARALQRSSNRKVSVGFESID